jgi:hypothetical protein
MIDEHGREIERITRDVPCYSMSNINFFVFDFFAGKKPHFYTTTSRYDWRKCSWPPKRLKGLEEWRNGTFKPAEESGEFEVAKDIVIDIDCRGHVGMSSEEEKERWCSAKEAMNAFLDHVRSLGIKRSHITFTGGGLHQMFYYEDLIEKVPYDREMPLDKKFHYHGEWAKGVVKDFCLALAMKCKDELDFAQGFIFKNVTIDMAPNYRRGVFRQPYSIHPKYGNTVWPLSKKEWEEFGPDTLWLYDPEERMKERLKNRGMPNVL